MPPRSQSYDFVDASNAFVLHVRRGQTSRRIEVSRPMLFSLAALLSFVAMLTMAAAGYLLFHDAMLAGLLDREAQMQYAYEDRLAALRLRLDQITSRQFVDQDGVEGKVQSLVRRQAQLETRAAVVAQLIEKTLPKDAPPSLRSITPAALSGASVAAKSAPVPGEKTKPAALQDSVASGKPQPEGMDLRLGDDEDFEPAVARRGKGEAQPEPAAPAHVNKANPSLSRAADPELPMPARLNSLSIALDRIEREQASRLSSIVKPAIDAAGRLRRAFDVAGVPIERFLTRSRVKQAEAVGGPFIPAPARVESATFETELETAQSAVATLEGLRHALPSVPLRRPLAGDLQMTSSFGYRTDPFLGRPALHSGVDLRDEYGEPARATAAGVVTVAGPNGGYGNMVEIDHGGGLATRYAHLSAIGVTPGQQVAPGAIVGRVGSTGRSTGPHLHYEVRIDGEAVDPARFLRAASALEGITQ
jgi:murein DD-endopeptidase MepM/ murein hydrolase activator NlpD